MPEIQDKATLDVSDYLKSLDSVDSKIKKVFTDANGRMRDAQGRFVGMGKTGEEAFTKVGNAADKAGKKAKGTTTNYRGLFEHIKTGAGGGRRRRRWHWGRFCRRV